MGSCVRQRTLHENGIEAGRNVFQGLNHIEFNLPEPGIAKPRMVGGKNRADRTCLECMAKVMGTVVLCREMARSHIHFRYFILRADGRCI